MSNRNDNTPFIAAPNELIALLVVTLVIPLFIGRPGIIPTTMLCGMVIWIVWK